MVVPTKVTETGPKVMGGSDTAAVQRLLSCECGYSLNLWSERMRSSE